MAQYSHLPIYNKAFAVLREFYIRVPKFGKQYKYFLGNELIKLSCKTIEIIIKANGERDQERRAVLMEHLCTSIEMMIIHLRIANELRQLGGQKAYLFLCEMIVDLSKQAEGWKKYTPQNIQAESLGSEG